MGLLSLLRARPSTWALWSLCATLGCGGSWSRGCSASITPAPAMSKLVVAVSNPGQPLAMDLLIENQEEEQPGRVEAQLVRTKDREVVAHWESPPLRILSGEQSVTVPGLIPPTAGEYEVLTTLRLPKGSFDISSTTVTVAE